PVSPLVPALSDPTIVPLSLHDALPISVGEKAPPFTRHTTWDEGLELCRMVEEMGYDSVTPVEVSVFPDTTLSRGGIPTSIWRNRDRKSTRLNPRHVKNSDAGFWLKTKR